MTEIIVVAIGIVAIVVVMIGIRSGVADDPPKQFQIVAVRYQSPDSDEWIELSRAEIDELEIKVEEVRS